MKTVYIMRGVAGSGKTFYARQLQSCDPNLVIVSADDFFQENGNYYFIPFLLPQAHAFCFSRFLDCLARSNNVAVDNVNSQLWEYNNYVKAAEMHTYRVIILEITCLDFKTLKLFHSRNTHSVPWHTMENVLRRWENDPRAKKL